MVQGWLVTSWGDLALVAVSAPVVYAAVILFTRLNGLRSFAKMSAFDFATTVAIGSLLGSTVATKDPPLVQGIVAIGSLFLLQFLVARARRGIPAAERAVDNRPLLLMRDGEVLPDNMGAARITTDDLWSQLRAANVVDIRHVRAVVLETSGTISVVHTPDDTRTLDDRLLTGVRIN